MRYVADIHTAYHCCGTARSATGGRKPVSVADDLSRGVVCGKSADSQLSGGDGFRRCVVTAETEASDAMTRRACRSFLASGARGASEDDLRLWLSDMLWLGIAPATRKRYFGRLHSLYLDFRRGVTPADDPFEAVREVFDAAATVCSAPDDARLKAAKDLAARCMATDGSVAALSRIFMYLLYDAGTPLAAVAGMKFDMPHPACDQIAEIIDRQRVSCRRQYVFDLGQCRRRPAQIIRELDAALCHAGRSMGVFADGDGLVVGKIKALWGAFAHKAGVAPAVARAVIGSLPPECAWLSPVRAAEIDDAGRMAAICRVADFINPATPRWHVMRLRRGVTPGDIRATVGEGTETAQNASPAVSLYYPMRRIARREGKKLTYHDEPFLPGILFFRTRTDRVAALMARMADKAWCYRTVNTPDAPYAVIPDAEMERFRKYTGCLTPDADVALADARTLGPGTRVRITGGVMEGYEGVVYGRGEDLTFALRLTTDTALKWTVSVAADMVEPLGTPCAD